MYIKTAKNKPIQAVHYVEDDELINLKVNGGQFRGEFNFELPQEASSTAVNHEPFGRLRLRF